MLLTENDVNRPPDDAVLRDPEVRQARKIADAARSRLLGCVAGPQEVVDLAQAQRMLDLLKEAQALAEDAEDRVLAHRGLLTPAEAERRAAARRPARAARARPARRDAQEPAGVAVSARAGGVAGRLPAVPPAARRLAGSVLLHALIPAAAGFAGARIARRRALALVYLVGQDRGGRREAGRGGGDRILATRPATRAAVAFRSRGLRQAPLTTPSAPAAQ